MADFLVYWKKYWKQIAKDPNVVDWYWHTEKESFFNEVEKGDCLWVVVTAGKPHPGQWRLIQRINIRAKRIHANENGRFEMEGNGKLSALFNIENQDDFAKVLHQLQFATGKRITAKAGAIGNTIQPPRKLTSSDSALLDRYVQKLRSKTVRSTSPPGLAEFFRQASFYRYHRLFQEHEREYKIQLANGLARGRELIQSSSSAAVRALDDAIKSKDDNIIYWEDRHAFRQWLAKQPKEGIEQVAMLWDKSIRLNTRFERFSEALNRAGLTKPGTHLAVTSTLLMALSPYDYPPVKVEPFSKAMKIAGRDGLYKTYDPFKRYRAAQDFMDEMIAACKVYEIEFRDRLDVQGVVWCVSGGWPKFPLPDGWINDPISRMEAEQAEHSRDFKDLEKEPGGDELTPTQKLILSKARIGQGKFREDLLKYWDCCGLTQCSHLSMLRASHIKPWKDSTNKERLDPFNGLLLSPSLDSAFDNGLITFDNSGKIKISKQLDANDRLALGIRKQMWLPRISPRHLPYLRYHREKVFVHK